MRMFTVAALLLIAAPAVAQTAPIAATAVKKGQTVKDAGLNRLGEVDRVLLADGNVAGVRIIYDNHFVTIPADKLVAKDGVLQTTLTRHEVAKLN